MSFDRPRSRWAGRVSTPRKRQTWQGVPSEATALAFVTVAPPRDTAASLWLRVIFSGFPNQRRTYEGRRLGSVREYTDADRERCPFLRPHQDGAARPRKPSLSRENRRDGPPVRAHPRHHPTLGCERVPPGPLPGTPAPNRIDPQQRSGDVRPATAGCLASTNMPSGCDTCHPLVRKSFASPNPAYRARSDPNYSWIGVCRGW